MSELKFTKGPWRIVFGPSRTYVCYGKPNAINNDATTFPPDQCICGCGITGNECGDGNNVSNAMLIQKSPNMYGLLAEVGADLEMALNGVFAETANDIKTWREILFEDVAKIKKLLKEARGEQ